MRVRALLSLIMLLSLAARPAPAQRDIMTGIETQFAYRIPLWLPSFEIKDNRLTNQAQRLEQVLFADLEFSGLFEVVRAQPVAIGMDKKDFSLVVKGVVSDEGGVAYFEGRVSDLASGEFIGGKRYKITEKSIRRVAHHFADEVARWVGEQGIASTRVVFTRKRNESWELVVSDYDGYNPRVLVRQSVPLLNPRWADGNKAVVYSSYRDGKPDLFMRYLVEAKSRPLANYNGINYAVDWSEKRENLVAALSKDGNSELYVLRKTGKVRRRLTHNRAIDTSPCWSPSGRELVFTSDRSGSPQLYLMEADGSNVRRLTFDGSYNASPAWSPQGQLIVFVSRIRGVFQLSLIRPDGSGFRTLTEGWSSHEDPRWAPNGRHVVYAERGGAEEVISIGDTITGGKRILAQGANPDWSRTN